MYKPKKPFVTPMRLLTKKTVKVKGKVVKEFAEIEEGEFKGSFATYGGTKSEADVNGLFSIIDTAIIETWYRPEFQSGCRVIRERDDAVYEIIGEPENIEERNIYTKFTVKRVKGGT